MNRMIKGTLVGMACGLFTVGSALAADTTTKGSTVAKTTTTTGMCTWTDEAKIKEHFTTHVTYPTTGAKIKEACKKEMPDEFAATERNCFEGKIHDKTTYKSSTEVLTALNMK